MMDEGAVTLLPFNSTLYHNEEKVVCNLTPFAKFERFPLPAGLNPGTLDHQELPGRLFYKKNMPA